MSAHQKIELGSLSDVSIEEQRRMISRWIAQGKSAADHPAVRTYKDGLPVGIEMTIIDQVSVNLKKPERSQFLSCSSCKTRNKFKDNGWLVSGGDGFWYIIGPDCWGSEHRAVLGRAVRDYKDAIADEFAEKRINRFYRNLGAWVELFRDAERASKLGFRAQIILKKHKRVWSDMRQVKRDGGELYVQTIVNAQDKYGDHFKKEDTLYAGIAHGLEMFSSPFECVEKVKLAKEKFEAIAGDPFSKQVFADKLFDAQQTKKVQKFSKSVKEAEEALKELAQSVANAARFFPKENLRDINTWYRALAVERARRAGIELSREELNREPRVDFSLEGGGYFLMEASGDYSRLDLSEFVHFSPKMPYSRNAGF